MGVGEKSAHEYRSRLCTKLEIKSPADLVRFAIDNGLIPCACQRTRSPARRAP